MRVMSGATYTSRDCGTSWGRSSTSIANLLEDLQNPTFTIVLIGCATEAPQSDCAQRGMLDDELPVNVTADNKLLVLYGKSIGNSNSNSNSNNNPDAIDLYENLLVQTVNDLIESRIKTIRIVELPSEREQVMLDEFVSKQELHVRSMSVLLLAKGLRN